MLIGRESECARIDELLDRARLGRRGALVLRGVAGIGKTALLDYAAERAGSMTVVRALGVESEIELEFSGLLEVCRPLLRHADELPGQQAEALRAALGLDQPLSLDRFAIGAATLGLLAAAAEANPLVVLADDAQWLDPASVDALLFATRRLVADRVAVLFAARDGEKQPFEAPGIEHLQVVPLGPDDARAILRSRGEVANDVAVQLYDATRGNPLALVETLALLSPAQLRGEAPLDDPLPVGAGVERAFAGRAAALPEEARRALLVVAVSITNALPTIVAALTALGLDARALELVEDAGLIQLADGRLLFHHPLVRSAVYHAAPASERRAAHRALAEVCADSGAEEYAWHLAAAALGPEEEVAAALERAAAEARRRSGYGAAANALERAARLTPEPSTRLRRLLAAADAAWEAGRAKAAAALVEEALADAEEPLLRAQALRLQGQVAYLTGRADTAAEALLEAVSLLEERDPERAVVTTADAVYALVRIRQPERALEAARRARRLVPENGSEADFEATATLGYALCFAGEHGEAAPHLQRAIESARTATTIPGPLQPVRLSAALGWLGRYDEGRSHMVSLVERARAVGAVGSLPTLLAGSAWHSLHAGHWNGAEADAGEAHELAEELGQPVIALQALGILTWVHSFRGNDAQCRTYGEETRRRAHEVGYRLYGLLVAASYGLLELAAGRVDEAIAQLEEVAAYAQQRRLRIFGIAPQLDLAEAYVRTGQPGQAETLVAALEGSELVADPFLAAVAKRCRGLLAEDDIFFTHFDDALALHGAVASPFARARTQLCYGERLRRAGRRRDARTQLRAALETFESLGASLWAERARSELRSSGETLRRRALHEAEQLTPQELQIALQVAEGKTNKEVGAALFLSHKTVEFHLGRVYRKLDINSRAELIRRIATEHAAVVSAS